MPFHPLRRISTGSLSSLARSQDANSSPSGLGFLDQVLTDLSDESATLATNMQRMTALHNSLGDFNEGFAAYLYALKMNAFCKEWPEAPDAISWQRAPELAAAEAPPQPAPPSPSPVAAADDYPASPHGGNLADQTYATVYSASPPPKPRAGPGLRKPAVGMTAAKRAALAAKKKRDLEISKLIDTQLPIEYRGGDADSRLVMEQVIGKVMDGDGVTIGEIVGPQMTHPRVNKCLIALVAKKLVSKTTSKGKTLYLWQGQ